MNKSKLSNRLKEPRSRGRSFSSISKKSGHVNYSSHESVSSHKKSQMTLEKSEIKEESSSSSKSYISQNKRDGSRISVGMLQTNKSINRVSPEKLVKASTKVIPQPLEISPSPGAKRDPSPEAPLIAAAAQDPPVIAALTKKSQSSRSPNPSKSPKSRPGRPQISLRQLQNASPKGNRKSKNLRSPRKSSRIKNMNTMKNVKNLKNNKELQNTIKPVKVEKPRPRMKQAKVQTEKMLSEVFNQEVVLKKCTRCNLLEQSLEQFKQLNTFGGLQHLDHENDSQETEQNVLEATTQTEIVKYKELGTDTNRDAMPFCRQYFSEVTSPSAQPELINYKTNNMTKIPSQVGTKVVLNVKSRPKSKSNVSKSMNLTSRVPKNPENFNQNRTIFLKSQKDLSKSIFIPQNSFRLMNSLNSGLLSTKEIDEQVITSEMQKKLRKLVTKSADRRGNFTKYMSKKLFQKSAQHFARHLQDQAQHRSIGTDQTRTQRNLATYSTQNADGIIGPDTGNEISKELSSKETEKIYPQLKSQIETWENAQMLSMYPDLKGSKGRESKFDITNPMNLTTRNHQNMPLNSSIFSNKALAQPDQKDQKSFKGYLRAAFSRD